MKKLFLILSLALLPSAFAQGRFMKVVPTIPDLLKVNTNDTVNPYVFVAGSTAAGDNGGGPFYFSGTSTNTTNATTIIAAPYGAATGRWLSIGQKSGIINSVATTNVLWVSAQDAGAVTTGSIVAPYKTIQAAINAIEGFTGNNTNNFTIAVEPGTYSETINLSNTNLYNLSIIGIGDKATIQLTGAIATNTIPNFESLTFNNLTFTGNINISGTNSIPSPGFPSFTTELAFNNCLINGSLNVTNSQLCDLYLTQINGDATFVDVVGPTATSCSQSSSHAWNQILDGTIGAVTVNETAIATASNLGHFALTAGTNAGPNTLILRAGSSVSISGQPANTLDTNSVVTIRGAFVNNTIANSGGTLNGNVIFPAGLASIGALTVNSAVVTNMFTSLAGFANKWNYQGGTNYTILPSDCLVVGDGTNALTLQDATNYVNGQLIYVFNSGAGSITITPAAANAFVGKAGGAAATLTSNHGVIIFRSGTAWINLSGPGL